MEPRDRKERHYVVLDNGKHAAVWHLSLADCLKRLDLTPDAILITSFTKEDAESLKSALEESKEPLP